MFTPWDTPCPLPGEGPAPGKIEALAFSGPDPDEEHQIEVARMHAVIHPDCYERLVAGAGLESPTQRLEIPKFFHISDRGPEDGPPGAREEAVDPTEDEIARMWEEFDDQSARRKRPPTSRLRVLVDGVERAGLATDRKSEASFDVEEGSKLIEVRTAREEGDLVLAVHALDYNNVVSTARLSRFSTEYEGGQKISFTVSSLRQLHEHEEDGAPVFGFSVVVSYEEARLLPALQHAWRRVGRRLLQVWRPQRWTEAAVLIAVSVLGLVWSLIVRERRSQQTQVARHEEPVTIVSPLPSSPRPSATSSPHLQKPRMASSPPSASKPPRKTRAGILRGEAGRLPASLLEVKKICVEVAGDRQVDPAIIDHLNRSLQASQRWTTVAHDKADALLSVAGSDGRELFVQLLNQEGKTLWPRAGGNQWRKYGATAEEASKVVADMLADVRELKRRRRGR
jgi:hypothetical protein